MRKESTNRYDSTILSKDISYSNDTHVSGINSNRLILGTSGCGKTSQIWQNLMHIHNQSAIVVDSKGQLYNMLKDALKQRGYRVNCLNLISPKKSSCGYNPLQFLKHPDGSISYANILKFCQALIPSKDEREPIWAQSSQGILALIISFMLEFLPPEDHNIPSVIRLYHAFVESNGDVLLPKIKENPSSYSAGKFAEFKANSTAEKMVASYYGFINAVLNTLSLPELEPIFKHKNSVNFKEIAHKKSVLFLVVSDNSSHLDSLLNAMYLQILQQLIEDADMQADGKLKIPVSIFLDDFGNTLIPSFDRIISITRSRDIQLSLALQSLSQLRNNYGIDASETIINNIDSITYMGNRDVKTAELLAAYAEKTPESILNMPRNKQYVFLAGEKAILTDKLSPYSLIECKNDSMAIM